MSFSTGGKTFVSGSPCLGGMGSKIIIIDVLQKLFVKTEMKHKEDNDSPY